jgi:hypothetical protein
MFVRTLALAAAAVLLMAGFASSGTDTSSVSSHVQVTMSASACRATPLEIAPGLTAFRAENRMLSPRAFVLLGRRTPWIEPGRAGLLRVDLTHDGVYRFFCVSQGREPRVRTGVVAVRPAPPA